MALEKMDPISITTEIPILNKLDHDEKVKYIDFYRRFLSKKPYQQVKELQHYVGVKLSTFKSRRHLYSKDQRMSLINDTLVDQYQRLHNIITHELNQRPIGR